MAAAAERCVRRSARHWWRSPPWNCGSYGGLPYQHLLNLYSGRQHVISGCCCRCCRSADDDNGPAGGPSRPPFTIMLRVLLFSAMQFPPFAFALCTTTLLCDSAMQFLLFTDSLRWLGSLWEFFHEASLDIQQNKKCSPALGVPAFCCDRCATTIKLKKKGFHRLSSSSVIRLLCDSLQVDGWRWQMRPSRDLLMEVSPNWKGAAKIFFCAQICQ